jgi:hypothetical protein
MKGAGRFCERFYVSGGCLVNSREVLPGYRGDQTCLGNICAQELRAHQSECH